MATRRAALYLLATLAATLAPPAHAAAQTLPPRLVVFEGFYRPG